MSTSPSLPSARRRPDADSSATQAAGDRYWLGDRPTELEHLLAQAEVYAREADQLLDRIGLRRGTSAIDIGCGALGILPQLCARVGAAGRVVGLDLEARLLEVAEDLTAKQGLAIETIHADATHTGVPAESFELVHARTLLLNVTNAEQVVAEMARIARRGGVVALQEPDGSNWACDPPHPAWEILHTEVVDAYPRTGRDFEIGRRSARLLRGAGLTEVHVDATARVTSAGQYYQTFLLTLTTLLRGQILAAGRLTRDRLDAYSAQLREHLNQPNTLTCQPLMWQAWATKL